MPRISNWGRSLSGQYPDPKVWPDYSKKLNSDAVRFVRLWLTEGIPFAFQKFPMVFEVGREELAERLDISPKAVSLVGSARIGYSFAPQKFGLKFEAGKSDFDFFIASESLFNRLKGDAELWLSRYRAGLAVPTKPHEFKYWPGNADTLPKNIQFGFISSWMLPLYARYEHSMQLSNALATFSANLNERLPPDYRVRKDIGIRVYKNVDTAISKIASDLVYSWSNRTAG